MKKICLSAGLVALGAAVSQAQYTPAQYAPTQYAPGLSSMETTKPWSLAATILGFYDDNYLALPKTIPTTGGFTQGARGSFGVELSPSVSYNYSTSDTLFNASYLYDVRWYQDRLATTDQTHIFNAKMDHEFSQRYKLTLNESFAVAQEPGVLDPGVISTPLRVPGSNIRNTSTADFSAQLTKLFDVHVAYANTYYAYQENAGDEAPPNSYPSYSALLDRMDQTASLDLRWKALPETTGVVGYQYEHLDYTSPEDIIYAPGPTGSPAALLGPGHFVSSVRNDDSHYVYLGVDQSFTPTLNASIRAGGQYIDYYNYGTRTLSPYIDANMTYQYMPQSTAQFGIKHLHNSTDVVGFVGTSPVLDEESTAVYLSVGHRVTSRFTVSAMGQAQYSTFNGGGPLYNGTEENFYVLSLNLAYHFTPWLTGETGYSYNKLNTALADRGYTRNQVYIGVRATY